MSGLPALLRALGSLLRAFSARGAVADETLPDAPAKQTALQHVWRWFRQPTTGIGFAALLAVIADALDHHATWSVSLPLLVVALVGIAWPNMGHAERDEIKGIVEGAVRLATGKSGPPVIEGGEAKPEVTAPVSAESAKMTTKATDPSRKGDKL